MVADNPPNTSESIFVKRGLEGQDDNIDILQTYFKELQAITVETSMDFDIDLLTFATGAHYFGVIMLKETLPSCEKEEESDADAEGEPEEDSQDVSDTGDPPPTPTSPSASSVSGSASIPSTPSVEKPAEEPFRPITSEEFMALSEQEKVIKWREAFLAKVNCDSDEEDDLRPPRRQSHESDSEREGAGTSDSSSTSPLSAAAKGKKPEIQQGFGAALQRQQESSAAHDPDDFINWPDDAPSDSDQDGPPPSVDDSSSVDDTRMIFDHSGLFTNIYGDIEVDDNFGREYLEPEKFTTPIPQPAEIPPDPNLQKKIMDSALRYRDELRAMRVAEYQQSLANKAARARNPLAARKPRVPPSPPTPPKILTKPIGIIYLATSQNFLDPLHMGECNIGAYVAPEYRSKEGIVQALNDVIEYAFHDKDCHRLQAIVVENPEKLDALNLFTNAGFRQEGIRRRAFYSPVGHEWKDVIYFAILATEWVYDRNNNPSSSIHLRPKSLWDEVFSRHQREREELIRLEDKEQKLKRTNSMETIRETNPAAFELGISSDSDASASASAGFVTDSSAEPHSPKRRRVDSISTTSTSGQSNISQRRDSFLSEDSDWEIPTFGNPLRFIPSSVRASSGAGPSGARKRTSIGGFSSTSSSSSSSQWDMLDGWRNGK